MKLQGAPIVQARIEMPRRGAWLADVRAFGELDLTSPVSLEGDGAIAFKGTVVEFDYPQLHTHARIIGGAGGLKLPFGPTFYRGTTAGKVIADALAAGGETLDDAADASVLAIELEAWTVRATTVGAALNDLVRYLASDATWRTLADGKVWVGRDTFPTVPEGFRADLVRQSPPQRRRTYDVDAPWIVPGVTLLDGALVLDVAHVIANGHTLTEILEQT